MIQVTYKPDYILLSESSDNVFRGISPWILQRKILTFHKILNKFSSNLKHLKKIFFNLQRLGRIGTKHITIGN